MFESGLDLHEITQSNGKANPNPFSPALLTFQGHLQQNSSDLFNSIKNHSAVQLLLGASFRL